jgi:hypothetical protein
MTPGLSRGWGFSVSGGPAAWLACRGSVNGNYFPGIFSFSRLTVRKIAPIHCITRGKHMDKETYLGDGCYASFDGWQICLRAPREEGDHVIYLEPWAVEALHAYIESLGK